MTESMPKDNNELVLNMVSSWLADKEGWSKVTQSDEWISGYKKALYDISGLLAEVKGTDGITTGQVQQYSNIDEVSQRGLSDHEEKDNSDDSNEDNGLSKSLIDLLMGASDGSDDEDGNEPDMTDDPDAYNAKVDQIRQGAHSYFERLKMCTTPVSINLHWYDGTKDTIIVRLINELILPDNPIGTATGIDKWIDTCDNRVEDISGSTFWITPDKIKRVQFNHLVIDDGDEYNKYIQMNNRY